MKAALLGVLHTAGVAALAGAALSIVMAPPGTFDPYSPNWLKVGNTMLYGALLGLLALFLPTPKFRAKEDSVKDPNRFNGPGNGPTSLLLALALLASSCGYGLAVNRPATPVKPDVNAAISKLCRGVPESEVRNYLNDRIDETGLGSAAARATGEEVFEKAYRVAASLYARGEATCRCFKGACQPPEAPRQ